MKRREFVRLTAAAAAAPLFAPAATHADVARLKTRKVGKVEIAYKSPHAKPNGLQGTRDGLWVQDQGPENWVSLVNWADGKVIREFRPDIRAASGVTVDDKNVMWISSTYNAMHVACSAADGKTIAKYFTPGAGRHYFMPDDPPAARSTLKPAYPRGEDAPAPAGPGNSGSGDGAQAAGAAVLPQGQLPLDATTGLSGNGAHGIEYRDGFLYFGVPPARKIFVMDPKTWLVHATWATAGNRVHGIGWEGDTLWAADSNLRAFFRHDIKTGKMIEKIQLTETDPIIHGATVRDGYIWFCDDVGWIANFKM
jgi:hypothetical protein